MTLKIIIFNFKNIKIWFVPAVTQVRICEKKSYFMMCGFSSLPYSFEMTGYKNLLGSLLSALVECSLSVRGVADSNPNRVLWILSVQKHEGPLAIHHRVQINDSSWRVFGFNCNKVSAHLKLTPFIVAFKYCLDCIKYCIKHWCLKMELTF